MERFIMLSFCSNTASYLIGLLTLQRKDYYSFGIKVINLVTLETDIRCCSKRREEREMSSMPAQLLLGRIVLCYPL